MAAEGAGDVPFLELVQQEEGFLPGEGGGELEELRTEDVRMGEDEGVPVRRSPFGILSIQHTLVDQVDLRLPERSAGGVQEDQVVKSDLPVLQEHDHVDLVEGGMKDIGPQGPPVVRDIMIPYDREKRIHDLVIQVHGGLLFLRVVAHILVSIYLAEVFLHVTLLGFLQEGIQGDVILRLGIGDIPQVRIEKVIVIQADFQHLVHAGGIIRNMAVRAHEERVVTVRNQPDLVIVVVPVKQFRHFHAVLDRRSGHEDADGAHLVAGGQEQTQ